MSVRSYRPASDHDPEGAKRANYLGTRNMVDAAEAMGEKQPKFVHISTVALYGHRNHLHPWGRVGDPLLPSVYDVYAESKLKGERYVLDSALRDWAVIRQTAMLHYNMMKDNMSDGLMFHTCVNVPLEWSTAPDSGLLIKRIVERDLKGEVPEFWKKCYNLGGGEANRVTGVRHVCKAAHDHRQRHREGHEPRLELHTQLPRSVVCGRGRAERHVRPSARYDR